MTDSASCELETLLQAHLDDELTSAEAGRVEEHLMTCGSCREAREELEVLSERLQDLFVQREQDAPQISVPGVPQGRPSQSGLAAGSSVGAVAAEAGQEAGSAESQSSGSQVSGGYRVLEEIARGGFGAVYKAIQLSMDRPVALKIMAPHLMENEEFVARFLREARVAATLSHPNLVSIYDVGRNGDQAFYAMELVEGEDAEVLLKREGVVEQRRAANIAVGVAQALGAAGKAGIVHRDIKPANILITPEGEVKLADLGLAKAAAEDADAKITMKKKVIGSPNYMSPEQAQDLRQADHRSDLYSLGATLLHMVTGSAPFGSGSPVEVLARVLRDAPDIPEALPTGEKLDPGLRAIISRAMEKDPADRYQTADELCQDLLAFARGEAVGGESARPASGEGRRRPRSGRGAVRRPKPSARRSARRRQQRAASSDSAQKTLRNSSSEGRVARLPQRTSSLPMLAAAAAVLVVGGFFMLKMLDVLDQPSEPVAKEERPVAPVDEGPDGARRVSDMLDEDGDLLDADPQEGPQDGPRDDAASLALAELEQWIALNPDELGAHYRRTSQFVDAHPDTRAAQRAGELRDRAREALDDAFAAIDTRASGYKADRRWWEAERAYLAFLEEHGEDSPAARRARLELTGVETQIEVQLESDTDRLLALLDQGQLDEAQALIDEIGLYAGPTAQSQAQGKLAALQPDAQPDGPEQPHPDDQPDDQPDDRQREGEALLASAREHLDAGRRDAAREVLGELRQRYGDVGGLGGGIESLAAALEADEPAPDRPELDDEALLAAYFAGQVETLDDGRVQISYDFSDEAQAADWVEAPAHGDGWQPGLYRWLQGQVDAPRGAPEPWTVEGGRLVTYGWSRRQLPDAFSLDRPLTLTVEARGGVNMLAGIRGKHTVFAGMGYLIDISVSELADDTRAAGINLDRNWFGPLDRLVSRSRDRGPSVVIGRERALTRIDEEFVQPHEATRRARYSVAFSRPAERDGEGENDLLVEFAVELGRRRATIEPQRLREERDQVHVTLLSFGAGVAYDEVIVAGRLEPDLLERLRRLAKEADQDPQALRRRVLEERDEDARREREERERERERQRREREREENGDEGDGGEGDEGEPDTGDRRDR